MNNNTQLLNSFNKVMDESCFVYKGVLVWKLIGGYRIFNHKVKSLKEVDSIIDRSLMVIKKAIKK